MITFVSMKLEIRRYTLVRLHMILASVIFPITVMFFLTGMLVLSGIKPATFTEEYRLIFDEPLKEDYALLNAIIKTELAARGIAEPLGKSRLGWDKKRQVFHLNWNGRSHRVKLRPSVTDGRVGVLKLYRPSLYNQLMRLHKGGGKDVFDVFVIVAAGIMMLVLISGILIGLGIRKLRGLVLYSMGTGGLIFVGLMVYSQYF